MAAGKGGNRMIEGVTSQPPRMAPSPTSDGLPSDPREAGSPESLAPARAGDVFVRSGAELPDMGALVSELKLELRGLQLDERPNAFPYATPAGTLTLDRHSDAGLPGREVRRVDLRLNHGAYAVDVSVDQDGGIRIRKLYKDGRSLNAMARDALKEKIQEDPALWGTLTLLAATGAVALANDYTRRTGDPVEFDLFNATVMRTAPWALKLNADVATTGKGVGLRGTALGTSVVYQEDKLRAEVGASYHRDEKWGAKASLAYEIEKNVNLRADARIRKDDYAVGVALEARF